MFTGIVEAVSRVRGLVKRDNLYTLTVERPAHFTDIRVGDSIANDGVCLTVTSLRGGLSYDLMKETLKATTLGQCVVGGGLNLERSLRADARLGGHFVSGHVDVVGRISAVRQLKNYVEYRISIPRAFMRYVASKGSVAVDGISLTIGEVKDGWFAVYFIPHTLAVTTIGGKKQGDPVNIETDLLAKYILKARKK